MVYYPAFPPPVIKITCLILYIVIFWIFYVQNVSAHPDAAQSFYQTYYTDILQHMFSVVSSLFSYTGPTGASQCRYNRVIEDFGRKGSI
jgi:amino acid transporter